MEFESLATNGVLQLVRNLAVWLFAIVVTLCGVGLAVYACLLWQVCVLKRHTPRCLFEGEVRDDESDSGSVASVRVRGAAAPVRVVESGPGAPHETVDW